MEWPSHFRRVYLVLLLMMALQSHVGTSVDITVTDGGGYGNVVVAIGNELQEEHCAIYVENIESMIENASSLLHSATGERMFFANVIIVIPGNWTSCGSETIDPSPVPLSFEDAHIRVQTSHPYFVDNPWTQQPRGCRDPGDYMYFSDTYISQSSPQVGSQGKVFVHEWAKFRWGVFEEYGHSGDSIFPSAYKTSETEWQPNYCANGPVLGEFDPSSCSNVDKESDCSFTPDIGQAGNISSSLLAVPFISGVNTFCNQDSHNATVPTKHNLMCDKKSTWEIISQHSDIENTAPATAKGNTSFSIQIMAASASHDRIMFLLDNTLLMGNATNRWTYLVDAVRQFIMAKAADGSEVGFLKFGSVPQLPAEFITLNSTNRKPLADKILEKPEEDFTSRYKNVAAALTNAAETLGNTGKIILVTENLEENKSEVAGDLVASANGLAVQPILYPANPTVSTALYKPVASITGLSIQIVNNLLEDGLQSIDNMDLLTQFIQSAGMDPLRAITSGSDDSKTSIDISLIVQNSTNYESQFFIELLLYSSLLGAQDFKVMNPSGDPLSIFSGTNSSVIYRSEDTGLQDGSYTVFLASPILKRKVVASIVSIAKDTIRPYSIAVSASKPLNNLTFEKEPPSAPIIYATITDGIHPIVFAEVTATIKNGLSTGTVESVTLPLRDNGVGGDVTGSDGTYSSYLVGIENPGPLSISISASDGNGSAKIVQPNPSLNAAPVNPGALQRACCGSSLLIPSELLVDTGSFSASSAPGTSGTATGAFAAANAYPPGRVTDLKGVKSGDEVNLTFTATGEDFNIGQATSYTIKNGLDPVVTQELYTSVDAGTLMSVLAPVKCGVKFTFTVQAFDSLDNPSDLSNEVHVIYSCGSDPASLTTGAIVGITLGCILFVILVIIIICACVNRDGDKDSKLGQMSSCNCCKKRGSKDKKRSHLVAPRTGRDNDVIRSRPAPQEIYGSGHIRATSVPTPARNVEDLYRKPERKRQEESDSEGGFKQQGRNARLSDDSSETSSVSSHDNPRHMAGNQVGIPLSNRTSEYSSRAGPPLQPQKPNSYNPNFGTSTSQGYNNQGYYNDSESGVYSISHQATLNKKPMLPPVVRRNNTQV